MNELVEVNETTVAFPSGNAEKEQEVLNILVMDSRKIREDYEPIVPDGSKEQTKAYWTPLKKLDDKYKQIEKRISLDASNFAGVTRILTQIAATRKMIKSLYAEKWEAHTAEANKDKLQDPITPKTLVIYATDSAFTKLLENIRAKKMKDVEGFAVASSESSFVQNLIEKDVVCPASIAEKMTEFITIVKTHPKANDILIKAINYLNSTKGE